LADDDDADVCVRQVDAPLHVRAGSPVSIIRERVCAALGRDYAQFSALSPGASMCCACACAWEGEWSDGHMDD
jgi:hypothetical protein